MATSGLSVAIACQSAAEPAANRALVADGLASVWGRNWGSGSVVVVGAGAVVASWLAGVAGATVAAVVPVATACEGPSPPRVSTTTPTPTPTTRTAITATAMRRRRVRRRRRAARGDSGPLTEGTVWRGKNRTGVQCHDLGRDRTGDRRPRRGGARRPRDRHCGCARGRP